MLRVPIPAPNFHSASAQALASLWMPVRTENRSEIVFTIGMLSHPGRLGGDMTTPVRLSSGPPQLIPTAPVFEASSP